MLLAEYALDYYLNQKKNCAVSKVAQMLEEYINVIE